jgi:phosphomannomutase
MKSVSGIRGVVGETFTPELIVQVSSAFARYCKGGEVVLGRDTRPTGEVIAQTIRSVLALSGTDVVDIGVVPTPTVQVMVEKLGAAGGIVISASHNPIEWNAFKLIDRTGLFLNAGQIKKFFAMMDNEKKYVRWNRVGAVTENKQADEIHIGLVLKTINRNSIRKRNFRVVLDSVNGAGSLITQKLLEELGCSVIPLYCDASGIFPRVAEPLPENLGALSEAVKKHRADIGFAQDPDADRLAIVDNTGRPIGEEYTLALVTEHMLSSKKGRVVTNLSTTRAIDDIAESHGVTVRRTKVGEINVADEMRRNGARIGGEGNGGIISPEVHLGRDSLAGIGYILQMMTQRKKPIAEIVTSLPQYVMKKGKVKLAAGTDNSGTLDEIKKSFKGEKFSSIDGLRIDFRKHDVFSGGWVHLRPSNTEPVFRIISEGRDKKHAESIYKHFAGLF